MSSTLRILNTDATPYTNLPSYVSPLKRTPDSHIDERVEKFKYNRELCDVFPNAIITTYNNSGTRTNISTTTELFRRRVVVFTFPGAFTPTCTDKHLKAISELANAIIELHVDKIICISVDNVDVVKEWIKTNGINTKIEYWADNDGKLTDKLGEGFNNSGDRGQGYALNRTARVLNNMMEEWYAKEEKPADVKLTHPNQVLMYLDSTKHVSFKTDVQEQKTCEGTKK